MFEPLQHLNALRAFEATARLGSIRLAAQELGVTDGAVSRHVKSLETALGMDLFIRAHRKLLLTPQSEDLAHALSVAFETVIRASETFAQSVQSSQLVIATPGTFANRWLLPRIGDLEKRLKGSQIKIVTWNRDVIAGDASIDLFVTVGAAPDIPGMTHQRIGPETFGPVLTPALWAQLKTPRNLLSVRRLSANWPPSLWRNWASEAGHNLGDATITRYERLNFALLAAEAGIGPAIAPGPAACDAIRDGRLVAPLGFHTRGGAWYVSWRNDRTSGLYLSAARWFAASLEASLAGVAPVT